MAKAKKAKKEKRIRFLVHVELPIYAPDEDAAENEILDRLDEVVFDGEPSVTRVDQED